MFDWAARLRRVAQHCQDGPFDAFVVSTPVNIRYLTGFAGSAGLLVSTATSHALITDGRYEAFVREQIRAGGIADVEVERVESRYDDTLISRLARIRPRRIAFEADHVTVTRLNHWRAALPPGSNVEWCPTSLVVESMRLIKDAGELDALRRGGRALSGVARRLSDWVQPGRSEREVARDIDLALERAGFERPAFETIVASGPNSAYPHARPTDRRLAQGDLVVLDFGGVLDGYCVDLTRMAGIGQIGSAAHELYTAVRDAQAAALDAVRPGLKASEVDGAARQVLEARGLGSAFVHGTGHGLGLEVHESPRVAKASSGATDVLDVGMVFTIEPGAYLERVGGVRLEDDVVVTLGGSELLTDAPRDLILV
jgi:Xaa-Pro aminopeptidase